MSNLEDQLFEYCKKGKVNEVKILLLNPNLNINRIHVSASIFLTIFKFTTFTKTTALHVAVKYSRYEVVKTLLADSRIDITIQDSDKKTASQLATDKNIKKLFDEFTYDTRSFREKYGNDNDEFDNDNMNNDEKGDKKGEEKGKRVINNVPLDVSDKDVYYGLLFDENYEKIIKERNVFLEEVDENFDECKEKDERLEYLVSLINDEDDDDDDDNEIKSSSVVTVVFGKEGNSLNVFKSLLFEKELFKKCDNKVQLKSSFSLHSFELIGLFKMLFGYDESKIFKSFQNKPIYFVHLYQVCYILGLKNFEVILLQHLYEFLCGENGLSNALSLFNRTFEIFHEELPKNDNILFKSPINMILFKVFKENFEKLRESKELNSKLYINDRNLFEYVDCYKVIDIHELDEYRRIKKGISVNRCYKDHLKFLFYNRKKLFNLVIICSDGKEIRTFKEILMFESDYFFKVLKFAGNELQSNVPFKISDNQFKKVDVLKISRLNSVAIEIFIKFIFLQKLEFENKDDFLYSSMNLFVELTPYVDKVFCGLLKHHIKEECGKLIQEHQFLVEFDKFSYLFHQQSHVLSIGFKNVDKAHFLSYFGKYFDRNILLQNINTSFFRKRILSENERITKENQMLKEENEKLHREVKRLREENQLLKKGS